MLIRLAYRDWLSRYPFTEHKSIVRRFRSTDNHTHIAAAFELALHEILFQLGGKIDIPVDQKDKKRHDFMVNIGGELAAIEATLVTDEGDKERAKQKLIDSLLDEFDEILHPRFALHVWDCKISAEQQPSYKRLRQEVYKILDSFNEDNFSEWAGMIAAHDYDRLPKYRFEQGGSLLIFSPVPRHPGMKSHKQIVELQIVKSMIKSTIGDAILRKIRSKAEKRYEVGEHPLILALGVTHWVGADDFEVFRALFGTERWPVIHKDGKSIVGQSFRDNDGTWGPHSRNSRSNVSAVLVFRRFHVWEPWATTWRVYVNPWAQMPPPSWLLKLPRWEPHDNSIMYLEGTSLAEVLGSHL